MRRSILAVLAVSGLCAAVSLGGSAQAQGNERLRWLGGDLPPFVWQSSNGPQGYAHELLTLMAQKLGRKPDVAFYPWARAVKQTIEGDNYGVFPLARTPDREAQFRWLIPLAHVHYSFFAASSTTGPLGLEQLRTQKIVVLRGSPIIKNLQAQGFTQIIEAKDYRDMLRMVSIGVVVAAYAGAPMMQSAMQEFGFKASDYKLVATLGNADLYMGTSLRLDLGEAQLWIEAYRTLEQDGIVARLQKKYQLSRAGGHMSGNGE